MTHRNLRAALDAREIKAADNLVSFVEGDIEDVDGVLKITKIRLTYKLKIPPGSRDKAERALAVYADKCPAYQSVKNCIQCTWQAEMNEI